MIRSSGEVKSYGKNQTIDVAQVDNDVYNEARARVISAVDDAEAGCVFGYEIASETRSDFSQIIRNFQRLLPVRLSRISVELPEGWRAESITFNRDKIEPSVNGAIYTWEIRDLPFIEREPAAPVLSNLVPRVAISIFPPSGKSTTFKTFASWKDVSRYQSDLSDPQAAYNDALAAKAAELTTNAKTEFERIQAVGRYAQNVNYISIQIGTGRGGGYRPHTAIDVFNKNYGDCKDKANLMRAMLKALKIEAYPVVIFSGDPTYVREEWPSPYQFNHCIISIKISDETNAPSIIKHSTLGRLLIFDPTDGDTPVGDLPDSLQGSLGLIAAGERGDLVRMPVTPPETNRLERTIEAELTAEGALAAVVRERSFGQAAVDERRLLKNASRPEYNSQIERWISHTAVGAVISKVDPADDPQSGRYSLDVEFKTPTYAQSMRGRLLVFKPAIVSRRSSLFLTDAKRKYPVVLESDTYSETVKVKLPSGFDVDEMPDQTELNQPFGNYSATFEVKDGHLIFKRNLALKSATVPVEQYAAVRGFFERIHAVEQASVVLIKK
ncbi:MAG: transglutaminase domain-containing protein [Acidobacteria bacterium]|nr:transglutaminase domain-containing protein [Acidobacteriota bacterium]